MILRENTFVNRKSSKTTISPILRKSNFLELSMMRNTFTMSKNIRCYAYFCEKWIRYICYWGKNKSVLVKWPVHVILYRKHPVVSIWIIVKVFRARANRLLKVKRINLRQPRSLMARNQITSTRWMMEKKKIMIHLTLLKSW